MEEEEEDAKKRGKERCVVCRGRRERDKGEKGREINERINKVKNGKQYILVKK